MTIKNSSVIRPAPLMIGGCPRSGTTALVQILNSNKSVRVSSEENLLNTKQVLKKLLGTRERRAKVFEDKGVRSLSSRETLTSENILGTNFSNEAVWPVISYLYKWLHEQKPNFDPLILWGDKLPNYFKDIDSVLGIQGVHYIHITRNPFDVVNSMLRRTEMAKKGKDWWSAITNLGAMISTWEEAYRIALQIEKKTNVCHIHYEDLVFDFENTILKLNQFLGVDLPYQNMMVADPEKHFERPFINSKKIDLMFTSPEICSYVEKFCNNNNTPNISTSLCKIVKKRVIDIKNITSPIRIFIAATPAEWLPARVLEYSIREQTELPVMVQYLYQTGVDIPVPNDLKNKPRTPFSFQRFLIPELCAHSGQAIYLDADMQVFQDISELWQEPLSGCDLQTVQEGNTKRRGQYSVMLLDCAQLNWSIKDIVNELNSGNLNYAELMFEMKVASKVGRDINPDWNSLETYNSESTKLLHYTDMNTQPWVSLANPLGYLWIACLRRAISSGFISKEEIVREVKANHVRPSLLAQLDTQIDNPMELPLAIKKLDRKFSAPYNQLPSGLSRPWTLVHKALRGVLKRCYHNSPFPRLFD